MVGLPGKGSVIDTLKEEGVCCESLLDSSGGWLCLSIASENEYLL
jgi:hypothetical protein